MQKKAVKKMKPKNMTSFMAKRKVVKKLVKRAVSRALLRKMNAEADHEVLQEHAEGVDLVPGPCGVLVKGKFVPLTSGFLVNSPDHEVFQEHAAGDLVTRTCGVIVSGEFVPLTSGFLVNSAAVPYYLPVIDNHGFLVGEFSKLDHLSISLEGESVNSNSWF